MNRVARRPLLWWTVHYFGLLSAIRTCKIVDTVLKNFVGSKQQASKTFIFLFSQRILLLPLLINTIIQA